jgi:hypothetical protein
MSATVKVLSLETVRAFRAALATFRTEAAQALGSAEMEIRRSFDWIEEQRVRWLQTVRQRQDEVHRARLELQRRKMSRVLDRQPDTTEQEEAYRKAQERLRYAEAKVESCRKWQYALPQHVIEYEGPGRQLAAFLDVETPRALALLDRKLAALEEYLAVAVPEGGPPPQSLTATQTEAPAAGTAEMPAFQPPAG